MPKNKKYRLSKLAKEDLLSIFGYTIAHWGELQASRYAQKLSAGFDMLSESPTIGKARKELYDAALSFSIGRHVIFYSINDGIENNIEISRVLHQSMDFGNHFSE